MIELNNITVDFDHVRAVDDVSLTVEHGDVFGIVGFSGAGKSTLVRTINLLQRPTQGEVKIDGTDLTKLSPGALRTQRKKIGMIFQNFNLLEARTILENVLYPLRASSLNKAEREQRARELLTLVGIPDKADAYPSQLSGGQKQRCAIARALANQPDILLCDEATSALDPKTTKQILQLLKQVNRQFGITIVIITHEMRVVKEICNRCAVMQDGRVIEQGETIQIFSQPKERLTKEFVETSAGNEETMERIRSGQIAVPADEHLAEIRYQGEAATEPLLSTLYDQFHVQTNILAGSIEQISDITVGNLIVALKGTPEDVEHARNYLAQFDTTLTLLSRESEIPEGAGQTVAQTATKANADHKNPDADANVTGKANH